MDNDFLKNKLDELSEKATLLSMSINEQIKNFEQDEKFDCIIDVIDYNTIKIGLNVNVDNWIDDKCIFTYYKKQNNENEN